ncbi:PDDEXK nuclease domain-containing protein [Capnocytophaga gingivalis]|uniref:PDDEXK nuclease domain-containing protein n=1 Tax=Capnocytophaga gingivalis TaxID=1017 RepID=A0ABU5Z8P4_9FLAO|nr:PDDEXK nuclease domain-containing protein [Capnocytophaga gingivalis]MEB3075299.1 PDDEXK nuclease domain-containing protein [Capnocytophaga gingivalis]
MVISKSIIDTIKTAILESQYKAAKAVNAVQLSLYFSIGKYVSEHTRKGFWGTGALEYISEQLQRELPGLRGFSATNIRMMRIFYEEWSSSSLLDNCNSSLASDELESGNSNSTVMRDELEETTEHIYSTDAIVKFSQLSNYGEEFTKYFLAISFTHHRFIMSMVKDVEARLFYIELAAKESLSVRALQKAIQLDEYKHKGAMANNFVQTLPASQQALKAISMFKDEYLLDFINVEELGVRDIEDIDERVVEQQIVQNIKRFIMTFGRDFAFLGSQYQVEALGHTHFIDLLFYHRELSCLVAIELKTGSFKNAYLGQLNAYLNILDDFVRKPNENPSVGIILCKDVDKTYVEYMVRTYDKPMGVATFRTADEMPEPLRKALPNIEELKKLL